MRDNRSGMLQWAVATGRFDGRTDIFFIVSLSCTNATFEMGGKDEVVIWQTFLDSHVPFQSNPHLVEMCLIV